MLVSTCRMLPFREDHALVSFKLDVEMLIRMQASVTSML